VEYGIAEPAEAKAKGTMRDDCISEGEAKSLSFAVRNRGADATTKKFNVFAEWEEVCHLSFGQEIFWPSIDGVLRFANCPHHRHIPRS